MTSSSPVRNGHDNTPANLPPANDCVSDSDLSDSDTISDLDEDDYVGLVRRPDDVRESSDSAIPRNLTWKIATMSAFCLGGFLTSLDIVIVGTALPAIAEAFTISSVQYSWAASSYLLASASLLPTWAKLSDIFGRKSIMLLGYVCFLFGSLVCAISQNAGMLIVGRALQGAGAGNIEVLINICLADLFNIRERGLYIGIYSASAAAGVVLGPVLGGALISSTSWRWCFWINLPVGSLSLCCLINFLDLPNPHTPVMQGLKAIDWPGALAISSGTIMLLLGIQFGAALHPWSSALVLGLILGGLATLTLFLFLQWKISVWPIIPLRLFSSASSVAALIICSCHGFSYVAALYFLPIYFSFVLYASPVTTGLYLLILTGPLVVVVASAGIIVERTGQYRFVIWTAAFCLTLGFGLFTNFPSRLSWVRVVIYQLILALGIGPLFQTPLIALQSWTKHEDISSANSLYSFTREMSSSVGVVVAQIIAQNRLKQSMPGLLRAGLPSDLVSSLSRDFTAMSSSRISALSKPHQEHLGRALTDSLRYVWTLETAIAGIAFMSSLLLRHNELSKNHNEVRTGLHKMERL